MNTLLWKRCIGKFYPAIFPRARKIILLYHAVGNGPHAIDETKFEAQIQWLNQYCQVIPLSELLNSRSREKFQVSITFDDGYACLYSIAAPILLKYKFSATVYVNAGWIGESSFDRKLSNPALGHYPGEAFLTWGELKEMQQQGWEVGSHGVDHLDLTEQKTRDTTNELVFSKQIIESRLKTDCPYFAYTWGKHNKKLREAVKQAGYQFSVAAHHAVHSNKEDFFALPRMNIEQHYSIKDFIAIIKGRWDYLGLIHKIRKYQYEKSSD